MLQPNPAKERLFKKVRGGDAGSMADLLEGERLGLYDYLLRMTGQISRSADTIDEVFQSLSEDSLEAVEQYSELKVVLFVTARKFNADIWNADTARLSNAALEIPERAATMDEKSLRERQAQALLDRTLRSMAGLEREVVCLTVRELFDASEISEIMGLPEHEVESRLASGMTRLEAEYAPAGGRAQAALVKLPGHPMPPRSSQATVNLSMVMQGIKTKPVGLWSPVRLGLLGLVLIAAALWFLYPGVYSRLFNAVKSHPAGETSGE